MKIFEAKLKQNYSNLVTKGNNFPLRLEFCIKGLRRFFYLPTKQQMVGGKSYFIAVYDRKIKESLRVRRHPIRYGKIQPELGDGWSNISFNISVEDRMIDLFKDSGRKYLYVRIEED